MKKYLFAIMLAVATMPVNAQCEVGTWSVIPRLGVSLSNMTNSEFSYDYENLESKYKAGMAAGADVEYQATEKLSVMAGVHYSMQGCRYSDCEQITGATGTGYKNHCVNLQYINVPILLNCYIADGLAVKAGIQVGTLVDAREKYDATAITQVNKDGSKTYGETTSYETRFNSFCNKTALSIPIGLSYEYMNVIIDARYNFGLSKIYDVDGRTTKNRLTVITVGYRFKL